MAARLLTFCCIFALVFGVVSWAGAEGMTPRQVASLVSVNDAVISPDGSRIAVVRSVPRRLFDEEDGKSWAELWLVDPADGSERPYVTGQVNVSGVAWLPDGQAVSFLSKRGDDEYTSLYLLPVDGGEARRVVQLETDILSYSWSSDSLRAAVIAADADEEEHEELEEQGFGQKVFEEDFHHRRLWVVEVDGGEPRLLELEGSVIQARWSPAGDRLAVALAPTPLVDDRYMRQRIHIVDSSSAEIAAVVQHAGKQGAMAWSPDGNQLAFIAGVDIHDPADGSLFVVGVSGGQPRNLTPDYYGTVTDFGWTDSETVVFLAAVGVRSEISRVRSSGGSVSTLGLGKAPAVFTGLDVASGDNKLALVGSSPSHPSEVWVTTLDTIAPRRLTDSNPWLGDVDLAPQEVVIWNARDGLELEGVLIHSLDREEGERVPLVMMVHGGPEGHRSDGWLTRYSSPAQVLAARGFAVFFPNYRGSTGRGVEFSKLGQRDAAGAEFDDLVDAVDHLIETGLVDPKRAAVTGGSYGGYATAWLATRYSERFAAGVMFVGISNKISKSGTTDIPNEENLVHARRHPWDAWQDFLERSPIYHAHKSRTPLLILHGEDDPRVSVTQSKEMYRALKTMGKAQVRLVLYPGEGHGNRKGAARYDSMLRIVRWFEHYLHGPGGEPPQYRVDYRGPATGWEADELEAASDSTQE